MFAAFLPLGGDVPGEAQQVLLALSCPEIIGQCPLMSCPSNDGILGTTQNFPVLLGVRDGKGKGYKTSAMSGKRVTGLHEYRQNATGRTVQTLAYAK